MLFIYTERNGAREYAVLRDGCQAQRVEGIIAEAYKQALGAPKFLWPDFYDRLTYDANDARESSGTDAANATMQQLENALSQPEGSPIFKGFRAALRKFLKESA